MLQTAAMLEEGGIDAIEMSGGTFLSGKKNPSRRGKGDFRGGKIGDMPAGG